MECRPPVGPPGRTCIVDGRDFPPEHDVTLAWDTGLTEGGSVTVRSDADGTIAASVLVFVHDQTGPRHLVARLAGYETFPETHADYLVVSGSGVPTGPSASGDPDDPSIYDRR